MRSRLLIGAFAGALLIGAACSSPPVRLPSQHYIPVSRATQQWGALDLSNTRMRLRALEGEMKLEYVGLMPELAGSDLAGAHVYRVRNADRYFKQNQGRSHFCTEPARWLAVNSRTGAPAWSDEIWIGLLTIEDWSTYTPDVTGYCAGGLYLRATD